MNSTEYVLRQRSEVLVIALVGKQMSYRWWNSKNKAFDNLTPEEMWKLNYSTVYNYLMQHASGDYS